MLHLRSVKKAVIKAFYSPIQKTDFGVYFPGQSRLQGASVRPSQTTGFRCQSKISFKTKIKLFIFNNLQTIKRITPTSVCLKW
jgi:hypothetical protein